MINTGKTFIRGGQITVDQAIISAEVFFDSSPGKIDFSGNNINIQNGGLLLGRTFSTNSTKNGTDIILAATNNLLVSSGFILSDVLGNGNGEMITLNIDGDTMITNNSVLGSIVRGSGLGSMIDLQTANLTLG